MRRVASDGPLRRFLSLLFVVLALAAVTSACRGSQRPLPPPESVQEARLANFRPLTDSGLAGRPLWSPDGTALIFGAVSSVPLPYSYRYSSSSPPEVRIWTVRPDGRAKRPLADGAPAFLSPDGSWLYILSFDSRNGVASLWRLSMRGGRPRQLLDLGAGTVTHMLADGRLVLSEWGTYAPLRLYDPATGKVQDLMAEHPSNDPQSARLSPDGTLMAYPKFQEVYLSQGDDSAPKLLSAGGGFSAQVWWSPDSRYLAYASGNHWTDRLLLADREGKTLATLIPRLEESGYVSALAWSPDSRWLLVSTEPYEQCSRPSQLHLFDRAGKSKLLLETYLAEGSTPAWSPDGHSLALTLWNGPYADRPTYDIWLADLTDETTVAAVQRLANAPTPAAPPTLPLPPPNLSPEDTIRRFWQAVDRKDYLAAYATLSVEKRHADNYLSLRAFYACVAEVGVRAAQHVGGDERRQVLSVQLDLAASPDCDNGMWQQPDHFYAVLEGCEPRFRRLVGEFWWRARPQASSCSAWWYGE